MGSAPCDSSAATQALALYCRGHRSYQEHTVSMALLPAAWCADSGTRSTNVVACTMWRNCKGVPVQQHNGTNITYSTLYLHSLHSVCSTHYGCETHSGDSSSHPCWRLCHTLIGIPLGSLSLCLEFIKTPLWTHQYLICLGYTVTWLVETLIMYSEMTTILDSLKDQWCFLEIR